MTGRLQIAEVEIRRGAVGGPMKGRRLVISLACWLTIAVGVVSAVQPLLLVPYHDAIARAFFGGDMPAAAVRLESFLFAPLGATVVGQAVLLLALARRPLREGQRWAAVAGAFSLVLWFVVDSATSLLRGAAFNVVMVNVPSFIALGAPFAALLSVGAHRAI